MNKTLVGITLGLLGFLIAIAGVKYFASGETRTKKDIASSEQMLPQKDSLQDDRSETETVDMLTMQQAEKPEAPVNAEHMEKVSATSVPSGSVMVDGKLVKIDEPVAKPTGNRSVERRPLEPESTKRLHDGPVKVLALFEASGKGEHASYGKAISGSFLYTTTVIARSEILEKFEAKETGKVVVKERRKFMQSRDNLSLSDFDVAVALDTLSVGKVKEWVSGSCHFVACICVAISPRVPPAAGVAAKIEKANLTAGRAFANLHKIDGLSARGILGYFGVHVPQNLERFVNDQMSKLVKKHISNVHNAVQSIEGKSFIITYEQEKNGAPLNVDYKNEDGGAISEAEWEILRSANAFMDANVVPDARCRVGDTWTIWADEIQELFGVAGNGHADGKIEVERLEDQADGTWTLKMEPSAIEFRSDDGTLAGKMQVKDGNGLVDAKNASVISLHSTAEGNLRSLDKKRHFMFFDFVKRIDGVSNLRFTLTVEPDKGMQESSL